MIVVDASVWVSLFVPQDVHHHQSRRWIEERISDRTDLVIPALLPIEVSGAISRRTGEPNLAHRAVGILLRVPGVRLIPIEQQLGMLSARVAADLRMRGADAVYVAVAHRLNVPLVTWDLEQADRASNLISAHTPGQNFKP